MPKVNSIVIFVSAWLSTYLQSEYLVSQTHRKISTCTKSDEKWVEIHPRSGLSFLTNSAFFGGIPAPGQSQHPAGKGFVGKKNPQTVSIQEGSRIEKTRTKNKESWKKNATMVSSGGSICKSRSWASQYLTSESKKLDKWQ